MSTRAITTAVAALLLSTTLAAGAIIPPRYEISFSSIDTAYDHSTGVLEFSQLDTVMVIEGPGQQQAAHEHVDFMLTAMLTGSASVGGKATGTFDVTSLTILEHAGTGDIQRLTATGGVLQAEESTDPLQPAVTFTGIFSGITDWNFAWSNPGAGEVFALAWELENPIDDFLTDDLAAESAVTLTPEPATAALVLAGAAALARRRRKMRS